MIIHYRNKSAGSWKISLAILTTQTTQTRGCGHSRTTTRQETTRRRRYVKRFFCLYLIPRFFVDNAFLTDDHDNDSCSSATRPRRVGVVVSFTIALRCAVKRIREESTYTAKINTADKGNHASLGREDEDEADPAPGSDIEMRTVGPDRDRDQGAIEVCLSPTFSMYVHSYAA